MLPAAANDELAAAFTAPPSVLDSSDHLLHGVVHVNGFGHLLRINGLEGGSKLLTGGVSHHLHAFEEGLLANCLLDDVMLTAYALLTHFSSALSLHSVPLNPQVGSTLDRFKPLMSCSAVPEYAARCR